MSAQDRRLPLAQALASAGARAASLQQQSALQAPAGAHLFSSYAYRGAAAHHVPSHHHAAPHQHPAWQAASAQPLLEEDADDDAVLGHNSKRRRMVLMSQSDSEPGAASMPQSLGQNHAPQPDAVQLDWQQPAKGGGWPSGKAGSQNVPPHGYGPAHRAGHGVHDQHSDAQVRSTTMQQQHYQQHKPSFAGTMPTSHQHQQQYPQQRAVLPYALHQHAGFNQQQPCNYPQHPQYNHALAQQQQHAAWIQQGRQFGQQQQQLQQQGKAFEAAPSAILQRYPQLQRLQHKEAVGTGPEVLVVDDDDEEEVQVEEEEEEDPEEDILDKVGKISGTLRAMLAQTRADNQGEQQDVATTSCSAVGGAPPLVTRSQLVEACGPLSQQLKSYQLVGVNFLMMLYRSESVGGAILADEMGLGKTAQTIVFLGALRLLQGNRCPHLIVCPSSLIQNWERELQRWCPSLRVLMFHGKDRGEVRELLQRWRRRARAAYRDGRIKQLPPGLPEEEGDARDAADAAERQQQRELEDDEEGNEERGLEEDADDGASLGGGLTLPTIDSGEAPFDVLLTTYSLFERDSGYQGDRAFLQKWRWSCMVADEAHALKNRSSTRTRKLRKIAAACQHRVLLTGTPLQNSLEELRALLELLMPSLFVVDPNHPEREDDDLHMRKLDAEEQAARVDRYKALLAPFMLRRLKNEVATQLQSKKQVVEEVSMTKEQAALYKAAVESMRREVAAASAPPAPNAAGTGPARARGRRAAAASAAGTVSESAEAASASGAGKGIGGANNAERMVSKLGSQRVSSIFTHLRKVAQHPLLVRSRFSEEQVKKIAQMSATNGLFSGSCTYDRVLKELQGYSDHQLHSFCSAWPRVLGEYTLDASALMSSAKLQLLDTLLPSLFDRGSRVLLFSQWTMTLDLLEWYAQHKGFKYVRLDGDTQVQDRLTLVDQFNDPKGGVLLFLLSTRAGGQGLNLTGADVVVLHDVDFNPQVDRQAEDRCHRLGQTKPVTVYRLVTKSTVDQNVLAIAERKLALDAAVLGEASTGGCDEGTEDGAEEGGAGGKGRGVKRGRGAAAGPGDAKEARHMGAILAALISDA